MAMPVFWISLFNFVQWEEVVQHSFFIYVSGLDLLGSQWLMQLWAAILNGQVSAS